MAAVISLSDRTICEELAAGRIVIDPRDDGCIQPSPVDLQANFQRMTTPADAPWIGHRRIPPSPD